MDNLNLPDFRLLVGKFIDSIGEFTQIMKSSDGSNLHVKFLWDNITEHTARWRQFFSKDGREWDNDWIMEFIKD